MPKKSWFPGSREHMHLCFGKNIDKIILTLYSTKIKKYITDTLYEVKPALLIYLPVFLTDGSTKLLQIIPFFSSDAWE